MSDTTKSSFHDDWLGSIERPDFQISPQRPIRGFHHIWSTRQALRYDMHFGLEVGVLLRGTMQRHYQGTEFKRSRGQVWLCGMWEPHGYAIRRAPCEAVVMIVYPPVLMRPAGEMGQEVDWLRPFHRDTTGAPSCDTTTVLRIAREVRDILNANRSDTQAWLRLKMSELLLLLQGNQASEMSPNKTMEASTRVGRAIRMVFASRRRVSTQSAARACGMNRNAFAREFQAAMGISFSEFGLRYRLRAAADQLRREHLPVKTIAANWGFTDTSHLHRCFRKYLHCPPSAYTPDRRKKNNLKVSAANSSVKPT